MSQNALSVAAGIGLSTLQRLEGSDATVRLDIALKVANALDVPLDLFYEDERAGGGRPATGLHDDRIIERLDACQTELLARLEAIAVEVHQLREKGCA